MSSVISTLERKTLIEYIDSLVAHSDGTYRCACELHGGDNPSSFTVFPDTNSYYCWGCGAHGRGVIAYTMEHDNVSFQEAVHKLCDIYGLTIDDSDEYREQMTVVERNASWVKAMEHELPSIVDYLHKRGLTDETIAAYHLGYAPKLSALSIPMYDEWMRPVAFLYRFFDKTPKYKNSKNQPGLFIKGEILYGLPQARKFLKDRREIMLCEGAFDCMSAVQQGNCCVAYCGITVSRHHVEAVRDIIAPVKGGKVTICPDNDNKAGKFVTRARDLFRRFAPKLVVKVAVIPDGCKDFNDMLVSGKDIANDCTYENIDLYCAKQLIRDESDREVQEKTIVEYCHTVKNPLVMQDIAEFLAKEWQRDISLVRELLSVREDTTDERLAKISTVDDCYDELASMGEGDEITTGFPAVDATVVSYKTDVLVLGAYSQSGKTEMAVEFILNMTIIQHRKILFFSLEMPRWKVMNIIVSKITGVPRYKVREYISNHPEVRDLINDKLSKYLYICDENSLSIDDMEEYLKTANTHIDRFDVVIVDYFQYMSKTGTMDEQKESARKMKALAKKYNILFIMLSQFNKASQSKENGKFIEPTLTSLMGAGDIGNSADTAIFLWRPVIQDSALSPIDREKLKYITMLKIGKARELRNDNSIFELEYNPATSRLTEKVTE